MSGLPREVIKWLQSLDLSYPVKNPKRDFANGYLIAEIFSRYYPNELHVWLFYTGDSSRQKASNWEVLRKFFAKHEINIPSEAMNAVMHCRTEAAIRFVENIYTLLTNRSIPRGILEELTPVVPHFALPTTSNVIRTVADTKEKAQAVLDAHNDFIKQLRAQRKNKINGIDTKTEHSVHPNHDGPAALAIH